MHWYCPRTALSPTLLVLHCNCTGTPLSSIVLHVLVLYWCCAGAAPTLRWHRAGTAQVLRKYSTRTSCRCVGGVVLVPAVRILVILRSLLALCPPLPASLFPSPRRPAELPYKERARLVEPLAPVRAHARRAFSRRPWTESMSCPTTADLQQNPPAEKRNGRGRSRARCTARVRAGAHESMAAGPDGESWPGEPTPECAMLSAKPFATTPASDDAARSSVLSPPVCAPLWEDPDLCCCSL